MIEIFEEGGFAREYPISGLKLTGTGEYELLSTSLNHRYYAVHNDRVLAREDWEAIGGKRGSGQTVGAAPRAALTEGAFPGFRRCHRRLVAGEIASTRFRREFTMNTCIRCCETPAQSYGGHQAAEVKRGGA